MDKVHPLRKYRRQEELTQGDLAKRLGVTRETIWRWESGHRFPKRRLWPLIQEVTGITPEELVA